jgi:glycerophosphoryl diester phosphodiesterase
MMKPSGLREIASYADAIGVSIKNVNVQGGAQEARGALVDDAHAEGLKFVVYTFQPENYFLGSEFKDGGEAAQRNESGSVREMRLYIGAGIDAVFTDDPALGRKAVTQASCTRDVRPPGE